MIGRLSGVLLEKTPPQVLVDCQGVGYEVDVPMSTFYNLPHTGEKVTLFTHYVVREDAHLLFGFGSVSDRAVFRQLIKITGVGARMALSILSGMTVAELAQAVTLQEAGRLVKVPGIGKKTAERLLLGQARGAAITALVSADLDVAEYTAVQVKQAVVGTGRAAKPQVQDMVARLLKLPGLPGSDAADALAVAICHAHSHDALALIGSLAPGVAGLHMKNGRLV